MAEEPGTHCRLSHFLPQTLKLFLLLLLNPQVFVDPLTSKDMEFIGDSIFPRIDKEIIAKMVEFSNRVRVCLLFRRCTSVCFLKRHCLT